MNIDTNDYSEKLLAELGFGEASEEQKIKVLEMVSGRFNDIVVFTLMKNLNPEQKQRFTEALKNSEGAELEDKIENIALEVPGLAEEIEQALGKEYEVLLFALGKQKSE